MVKRLRYRADDGEIVLEGGKMNGWVRIRVYAPRKLLRRIARESRTL